MHLHKESMAKFCYYNIIINVWLPQLRQAYFLSFFFLSISWINEQFLLWQEQNNNIPLVLFHHPSACSFLLIGMESPDSIEQLPIELLTQIMRHLSLKDKLLLEQVSHLFHSVSLSGWPWTQNPVELSPFARQLTDSCFASMLPRLSKLEELSLSKCKLLTDASIIGISLGCPSLRTLSLAGCGKFTSQSIKALLCSCTRLTSLDLSLTGINRSTALDVLPHISNLKVLIWNRPPLQVAHNEGGGGGVLHCVLCCLSVSFPSFLFSSSLFFFLFFFPLSSSLLVQSQFVLIDITTEFMNKLLLHGSALIELRLIGTSQFDDRDGTKLSSLTNLRHLSLRR